MRLKRCAKPPYRHNDVCRARMEGHIKHDDKPRWERYNLRKQSGEHVYDSPDKSKSEDEQGPSETLGVLARDSLGESGGSGLREANDAPADEHGFPMISPLTTQLMSVDVVEAYSPPRVTEEAEQFGLKKHGT